MKFLTCLCNGSYVVGFLDKYSVTNSVNKNQNDTRSNIENTLDL